MYLSCEKGAAFIEMFIVLPVLVFLILGLVEATRYVLIVEKVEKVTSTMADITSQTDPNLLGGATAYLIPAGTGVLPQLMKLIPNMMAPYGTPNDPNMSVILTDVLATSATVQKVQWQYCGGGTYTIQSNIIGTSGSAVVGQPVTKLPKGLAMPINEEVIVSEVFYNYKPFIIKLGVFDTGNFVIYRAAFFVPRLGSLVLVNSHC